MRPSLRSTIREFVSEYVRLPRGPNSRDDGEDRPLGKPADPDSRRVEEDEELDEMPITGGDSDAMGPEGGGDIF